MPNVTEQAIPPETAQMLHAAGREGLAGLKLDETANPQSVVEAIDAFVDAWQEGGRPPKDVFDPDVAHFAMGSLWGEQRVQQFHWEWAFVIFHDHGNSKAPGVLSPDRALAIYPIHFLKGCFQDPRVGCTAALSAPIAAESSAHSSGSIVCSFPGEKRASCAGTAPGARGYGGGA